MELVKQILTLILSMLKPEQFKKLVDALLDKIEEIVSDSENKIDDALVLPLCRKARELLDVPDDDNIG